MKRKLTARLLGGLALGTLGLAAWISNSQWPDRPDRPPVPFVIRPQDMADAIYAVVAGHREVYATLIVQRLQEEEKVISCSDHWERDKALPVPTQLLRLSNEAIQSKGAEFHYSVRALQPINPKNAPETEIEKKGLEFVLAHPEANFYTNEMAGGRRYFTAVYPDKAITPVCATCHNRHPNSAKKDLKRGDVMGGIVVRVPLEF